VTLRYHYPPGRSNPRAGGFRLREDPGLPATVTAGYVDPYILLANGHDRDPGLPATVTAGYTRGVALVFQELLPFVGESVTASSTFPLRGGERLMGLEGGSK